MTKTPTKDIASARVPRRAATLPDTGEASRGISDSDTVPRGNILDEVDQEEIETRSAEGPQTEGETEEEILLASQIEDDETLLTRRKEIGDGDTRLDVPDEYKRPGWDYEWKTARVNGADVDQSENAAVYEGGWRPVLARSMPKMVTPGYVSKYINRLGQLLYARPMHLTEEARREEYDRAERQKFERLRTASDIQMPKGSMRTRAPEIQMEGVVGTHRGPDGKRATP